MKGPRSDVNRGVRLRVAPEHGEAAPMQYGYFLVMKQQVPLQLFATVGLRETGELGFEPRLTDPESVVLPLHQSPLSRFVSRG